VWEGMGAYQVAHASWVADAAGVGEGGVLVVLVAGCGYAAGDGFDEG
jgi:hypothetical protein